MFHTSCDELVRQVGIYFDNKYLILASPEEQVTKNKQKYYTLKHTYGPLHNFFFSFC